MTRPSALGPLRAASRALRHLFELADTDHEGTVQRVEEGVDFTGGNLWALVLAILVASVGLNVNSTAVIIGAMLISPLMGPIVGAGLGIGVNDLGLLRRSVRNLAVAALVSVVTSALYFALSPLSEAQSELLARTRPTLYDVMIAFFGGSAGFIAASRRGGKGNVVSGVAIATALIPPLCTAGFGLATGQWRYFFGAFYLFLINSVFIALATVLFVRFLRFAKVHDLDPARERRVRLIIAIVVFATAVPSAVVAWLVVKESVYLAGARRFVRENLTFDDRTLISTDIRYGRDSSVIAVAFVGRPLPEQARADLVRRLAQYGLNRTRLVIREPSETGGRADELTQAVRTGILEDLYRKNQEALEARDVRIRVLEDEVVRLRSSGPPVEQLAKEVLALHPTLAGFGVGREIAIGAADTAVTILTRWGRPPGKADLSRLEAFLKTRLDVPRLELIVAPAR